MAAGREAGWRHSRVLGRRSFCAKADASVVNPKGKANHGVHDGLANSPS
jgi:hypothetical protein